MNTLELIDFVRDQTNVSSDQISDARMLTYANFAYKRVVNIINGLGDFVANIFQSNLVEGVSEYTLPVVSNLDPGLSKLSKVSVKYNDKWVNARLVSLRGTSIDDFAENAKNQSETDPIYVTFDSSIFLFPAPKFDVVDGIKLYGNMDVMDLTVDTNSILVTDYNWSYAVALAMVEMIEKGRGLTEKKNDAISEFSRYTEELIDNFTNRNKEPVTSGALSIII